MYRVHQNQSLFIRLFYFCSKWSPFCKHCHNIMCYQSPHLWLFHLVPPTFIEPPKDKVVSLDDQTLATFLCIANGFPTPTIVWYHNGDETTSIEKYDVRPVTGNDEFTTTSVLTIYSLENHDSGSVSCVAMVLLDGNNVMVNSTVQLSVLGKNSWWVVALICDRVWEKVHFHNWPTIWYKQLKNVISIDLYSGTPLKPLGNEIVSFIERCPFS